MDVPTPPQAVQALASFVRARLGEMTQSLAPLLGSGSCDDAPATAAATSAAALGAARQFATVVVGAAAPFAPTSYARARLIRQLFASGLLNDDVVGDDDAVRLANAALREPRALDKLENVA